MNSFNYHINQQIIDEKENFLRIFPTKDPREYNVAIDGLRSPYIGRVYDLPRLVETYKSADESSYYKSSNITQILCMQYFGEIIVIAEDSRDYPEGTIFPDGLTPPLKVL